jgi:hypothetical protein
VRKNEIKEGSTLGTTSAVKNKKKKKGAAITDKFRFILFYFILFKKRKRNARTRNIAGIFVLCRVSFLQTGFASQQSLAYMRNHQTISSSPISFRDFQSKFTK